MKFFVDLKFRSILLFSNFLFVFNIVYYYKNCLTYLLIKSFIFKHNLNFYLIYTNIVELFTILYFIIIYISFSVFLFYASYSLLTILKPALYFNEYHSLKFILLLFLVFFYKAELITIFLIPFLYKFFEFFNNNFILNIIHLEIKLDQYFYLYYLIFKINIYFLIFLLVIFFNFQVLKKYHITLIKYRKSFYLFSFILLIATISDFFNQFTIIFIIAFFYELILFLCYIKIKIKWDSNPYD